MISDNNNSSTEHTNVLIIGGGIGGLYFAYKLKLLRPDLKYIILERGRLGGRVGNEKFYDANILIGAGIGRCKKDEILLNLIHEFNLETREFISKKKCIGINEINMENIFSKIKLEFIKCGEPKTTFKEFASKILGSNYDNFIDTSGYTDYENQDCFEVLHHYSMSDNYNNNDMCMFTVPWSELINKLVDKITNYENIKSETAESITKIKCKSTFLSLDNYNNDLDKSFSTDNLFKVSTDKLHTYTCNHIVIATDIDSIRKLLYFPIYNKIHGQSFIRTYAKFTIESTIEISKIIAGTTCVKKPLQKIIPMSNGVFMIAYSDNKSADYLSQFQENIPENCKKYSDLLKYCLNIHLEIIAIKSYYWKTGTHFYSPINGSRDKFLKKIRNPLDGISVIGEAVSRDHGWTKGALITANYALLDFIK